MCSVKGETKQSNKNALMQRILTVRYTDVEEENRLCKELLALAEANQEHYQCAFSHVYLMDSLLAVGDYSGCIYHLTRGEELCRENGYDSLLLLLCNLAGLYYSKLNNEQLAIKYHLEGLTIAKRLGDWDMEGTHYNNIGLAFGYRRDWGTAKQYFMRSAEAFESNPVQVNLAHVLNVLCNIAETCLAMGNCEEARQALDRCDSLAVEETDQIRISLGWIMYYQHTGDKVRCMEQVQKTIDMGFLDAPDKFFSCYMLEGIVESMLGIGNWEEAKRYLDILDSLETESSITSRYHIQCLKIKYWKETDRQEAYEKALEDYYAIMKQLNMIEDEMRIKNIDSQIEIVRTQGEQQALHDENEELERITHLDALTGLYNRRYLNKLITKMQQNQAESLGYIMLDMDFFKQYNDYYGHFIGDKALKEVAQVLSENATEGIYAGRYGGDEFFCLCVNVPDSEVTAYVERVQKGLAQKNIPHEKSSCSNRLTLSIGYHNSKILQEESVDHILALADSALYQVKQAGRNGAAKL